MSPKQDNLSPAERREVEETLGLRSPVIYEVIRREGVEELERPVVSLWWSGVAAGTALSSSVYCESFLHLYLPDSEWRPLVENFGYCVGFLIVVLGRLQLFTENTITAILPLLADRTLRNLSLTARLWGVVFLANMAGSLMSALLTYYGGVLTPEQMHAALEISHHYADKSHVESFLHGIPAGFFVAALVWMLPSAGNNKFWVIVTITYMIALGDFAHVIAGSTEVYLLSMHGDLSLGQVIFSFIVPTFLGNVIGGTVLFALLAYGQVQEEL